jgi:predicted ester cyclase
MSAEELKSRMRRLVEELNKGKAAALTAIEKAYATDVTYTSGTGVVIHGLKDYKQFNSDFYDMFPDAHYTIDDMITEKNKLATRYTVTGTHKGEAFSRALNRRIPPTNKKVTFSGIIIDRIADGKFVEEYDRFDTLGLMQQLGLIPTPANKPK